MGNCIKLKLCISPRLYKNDKKLAGRKEGSGVALLIKQHFYFTICDNYKISSFESVFIELSGQVNNNKPIIGAIYRPPNTDQLTFNIVFYNLLRSITKAVQVVFY